MLIIETKKEAKRIRKSENEKEKTKRKKQAQAYQAFFSQLVHAMPHSDHKASLIELH
jgi:hypothetical protein